MRELRGRDCALPDHVARAVKVEGAILIQSGDQRGRRGAVSLMAGPERHQEARQDPDPRLRPWSLAFLCEMGAPLGLLGEGAGDPSHTPN